MNDTSDFVHCLKDLLHHSDMYISTSKQHDNELNDFWEKTAWTWYVFGLCFLNGFIDGDLEDNFTYISDHGNSVVDYFSVSNCFLPAFQTLREEWSLTTCQWKHTWTALSIGRTQTRHNYSKQEGNCLLRRQERYTFWQVCICWLPGSNRWRTG